MRGPSVCGRVGRVACQSGRGEGMVMELTDAVRDVFRELIYTYGIHEAVRMVEVLGVPEAAALREWARVLLDRDEM